MPPLGPTPAGAGSDQRLKPWSRMLLGILGALGGYAIGTLQVFALDWAREIRQHGRHLRAIRAELRRARTKAVKFGWRVDEAPVTDGVPEPPTLTEGFPSLVAAVDFRRTDELADDNTQEALLTLLDGLGQLQRYHASAMAQARRAGAASDSREARVHKTKAVGNAKEYDLLCDTVMFGIDSALDDLGRRLNLVGIRKQLRRVGRGLPSGPPPTPVAPGDPRLEAWRGQQVSHE